MATKAFTGGEKLEKKLRELAKKLGKGGTLNVGFLEGSTEEDGTSLPMVAAIQEFGAPDASIPSRPYFRSMISKENGHWGDDIGKLLMATNYDVALALGQMGAEIKGELQQSIIDLVDPPLSDITVMLRHMRAQDPSLIVTGATVGEAARRVAAGESPGDASTKPLIDSGTMLNGVDFEVET